jgi:hypothetical protein
MIAKIDFDVFKPIILKGGIYFGLKSIKRNHISYAKI